MKSEEVAKEVEKIRKTLGLSAWFSSLPMMGRHFFLYISHNKLDSKEAEDYRNGLEKAN